MRIVGFGFNCVPPEDILGALNSITTDMGLTDALRQEGVELVAYANLQAYARKFFDTGYQTDHNRHNSPSSRLAMHKE